MKTIYNLLVLITIVIIWWLWYFWYQTFDFSQINLWIQLSNDKSIYTRLSWDNASLQDEIYKIRSTSKIANFEIAKIIDAQASNTNRYQRFDKLSTIYNSLSMVNKNYLDIKEYYVNNADFGMNGKIINLNIIYNKWAVLDKFRDTGIFDEINSPKNNKQTDAQLYNFEIKWDIKWVSKIL